MSAKKDLLRRLAGTKDLPSLPQVVSLALSTIKERRSNAEDVAEILAEDPAMTAHVLRIANSVLFNPMVQKISSVQQAISRIGFAEAQRVIIAIGVIDLFQKSRIPFDYHRYWRHCIATAIFSELIARRSAGSTPDSPDPDHCFVGGLLHDIGILPLAQHLGDRYGRLIKAAGKQEKPFYDYECKRLGVGHQEIGAELIRRWNLGENLSAAVEFHHQPERASEADTEFCRIIHVGDWLANHHGLGFFTEEPEVPIQQEAWCKLTLSKSDIPGLTREFDQIAEESSLFNIFE